MAFPPPTIQTNITDATDQAGLHPQLHNALAAGLNDTVAYVQTLTTFAQDVNGKVDALTDESRAGDAALDARLDTVEAELVNHETQLDALYGATAVNGMIRGRTNIDPVQNGGSVRYTQAIYDDFTIVDVGDGSGFRTGSGVFAVTASTVADAGSDLTCYLNIGTRSVAVGSRIPNDATTYLTWVGRVVAGEVISVHVSMPTPRAVVGGRLEIWRVAVSS